MKAQNEGNIGQVIREDIEGDKLSNTKEGDLDIESLKGAFQNLGEDGPHFDYARPDNPDTKDINEEEVANKKIENLGKKLKEKGVE